MVEKKSTLEKILEIRRQKVDFGGFDDASRKITAEKISDVKIPQQEKKSEIENVPTIPTSSIPIRSPQPCPICQCPAFWVSVYDASHAHCRVCEPEPVAGVVQASLDVILSLSESLRENRSGESGEREAGEARRYQWETDQKTQRQAAAGETRNDVVDSAAWSTLRTADGYVATYKGPRTAWLRLAEQYGMAEADAVLTGKFNQMMVKITGKSA